MVRTAPTRSSFALPYALARSTLSAHSASNAAYLWTQSLIEELTRHGVDTFFVAPGSRSTPLTTAVARHPTAQALVHYDERGTAFAALGYGRATGRPAGWITTSGTAVANGLPAVVEAATDDVPLLLLTADRPPELRDTGANQTVDQIKIFGDHVRWFVDLPVATPDVDPAYVLTTAAHAVARSTRVPAGPVHLNVQARKPLESDADGPLPALPEPVRAWQNSNDPYATVPTPTVRPPASALDALADALRPAERGLIVAGRLDTEAEAEAAEQLARHLQWPLLPGVLSRRRRAASTNTRAAHFDLLVADDRFAAAHRPDAVIHVGGRIASKRLRLFLRNPSPRIRVTARPSPSRLDPDHRVTHHFETKVGPFVDALCNRLPARAASEWTQAWMDADAAVHPLLDAALLDTDAITEPGVARLITKHLPAHQALVLASSMPVRDAARYGHPNGPSVPVFANRGASGIDGTVAFAAGIAAARDAPATLLIGDVALWHDLNSLALAQPHPIIVLAINNDGGGIFHFLPIRAHTDVFESYFATPHGRSFADAAATFGLAYHAPNTLSELQEVYTVAAAREESALIEINTDRDANHRLHKQLQTQVAAVL